MLNALELYRKYGQQDRAEAVQNQQMMDQQQQREFANNLSLVQMAQQQQARQQAMQQAAQQREQEMAFRRQQMGQTAQLQRERMGQAERINLERINAARTAAEAKAQQQATGKALPISAAQKLLENDQNLRRAEMALSLTEGKDVGTAVGDKDATGWKGYVPEFILQRTDTQGVDARAAISDLGSLVIHDRSGAAVTAAEFPRLRPFIPQATDDPDVVRKKLRRFVSEYQKTVQEAKDFYTESGYKIPETMNKNTQESQKTSGGWDNQKEQRLQELRRKRDQGGL